MTSSPGLLRSSLPPYKIDNNLACAFYEVHVAMARARAQSVGMRDCSGTQQHWRERIETQRSSGLSVTEFCRREGIGKAGFYYWKRRVGTGSGEGFLELKVAPPSQIEAEARAEARRRRGR
jgi:hypothetical protein